MMTHGANTIQIREVETRSDLKAFVRFPFSIYQDQKCWVPPVIADEMATLSPEKNPAFQISEAVMYLAFRDGQIVGRIAGIINRNESAYLGFTKLRFGWFDFIEDFEVSKRLIDAITEWGRARQCSCIEGPQGFTNLDKAGFLIDGFDELATISTIYNYPYYIDHLERLGFERSATYVEYEFAVPDKIPEKVNKFSKLIRDRYNLHIVGNLQKNTMEMYALKVFRLINETHRSLHGFIPISEAQIKYYVDRFKNLLNPAFVVLIEDEHDNLIAYALSIPSYAKAFQKMRGKLFPFGFFHILKARKKVYRAELLLIGVNDQFRKKGVTAIIFHEYISKYIQYGVQKVESNPELLDNKNVHALWKNYESRQHKRRAIFKKQL